MAVIELNSEGTPLDRATARRLATLRSMPVDTSRLEKLIQAAIPASPQGRTMRLRKWTRSIGAIAASFMVIAVIAGILLSLSSQPVEASVGEMVKFHNDLVAGRVPVTRVDSIQDANKVLAAEWSESPKMPNMPYDHVMACCMRSVKDRKMACVLLKGYDEPVSMTVANATDVKTPSSPIVVQGGIEYHVQSVGALNMVMTQRNGRWVCMIAKLPPTKLMDLAASLQF